MPSDTNNAQCCNTPSEAESLIRRDSNVIAAAEKVRFFNRPVVGGRGSLYTSADGEELIDLSATWTAAGLGYAHPLVREAVDEVLRNCPGMGIGSVINPQCLKLAQSLLAITDSTGYDRVVDDRRVYFGHSGSDANDVALRLCRKASVQHGGGRRVLAFEHSYHGGFGEALGLSGVQVEGGARRDDCVTFLPYPDPVHPHTPGATASEERDYCLAAVRVALEVGDAACLIVEAILSDGGMIVPPDGFLQGLRELCSEYTVPMICDEVKVGLGRPGTTYAYQHEGIHPDVVTIGKTLGSGLPISAIIGPASILDCAPGSALLTMGGNPVCAAAANAFLQVLAVDDLADKAASDGEESREFLAEAIADESEQTRAHVVDIRGRGLAMAVELTDPDHPGDRTAAERFAEKVCFRANQLGVVLYYVGGHVLEITPALTIDAMTLRRALALVVQAIVDVTAGAVSDDEIHGFGGW
ncbi:aminotransferase class III [Bifidobacterium goeldii]|uniref:Aminotransferase class III n=1 Tax=Bifidobacterium goeldii TaxID=2306975 RepID=A0A430FHA4_9BIFI|nr:aminotransferase class III-fold pyridoxal phosphate-dependent enzyme [Bifidobacterium goeldii]RSX52171.1 aminotransferase class III [Bifidobacterium goeldii]